MGSQKGMFDKKNEFQFFERDIEVKNLNLKKHSNYILKNINLKIKSKGINASKVIGILSYNLYLVQINSELLALELLSKLFSSLIWVAPIVITPEIRMDVVMNN